MTVTVVDGDFKDEYKLTSVRVAPSLTALSLDGIRFAESFSATKTAYTATTAAESVTVAATPRDESYTVTVNGGSDTTVPLNLGENKIDVVVTNPAATPIPTPLPLPEWAPSRSASPLTPPTPR